MKYNFKFSQLGINDAFGRIERIRERLKKELELKIDDIVLDIGCDKGELVEFLRPHCEEVVGIDINKDAISNSKISGLMVADARKTSFLDGRFTKIVSSHTIEHIPNIRELFREIDRILRTDGLVILYYPWEIFRGMGTMRNAWIFYKNRTYAFA